jgi:hypothetical protein
MGRNAGASVSHPLLPLREDFDKTSPPDVAAWRDEGGTGYGEGVTSSDKIADGCTARFYRGKIWGFLGEIAYKLLTNAKGYGMLTASREGRRSPEERGEGEWQGQSQQRKQYGARIAGAGSGEQSRSRLPPPLKKNLPSKYKRR